MQTARLEHVNVTVRNPDRVAQLLSELFGWKVRWQGEAQDAGYTVHVGDDAAYLALYTKRCEATEADVFRKGRPLNHIGVEVGDLDRVEAEVRARGLEPFGHAAYAPGRRFYFLDFDGTEYEVVSYR